MALNFLQHVMPYLIFSLQITAPIKILQIINLGSNYSDGHQDSWANGNWHANMHLCLLCSCSFWLIFFFQLSILPSHTTSSTGFHVLGELFDYCRSIMLFAQQSAGYTCKSLQISSTFDQMFTRLKKKSFLFPLNSPNWTSAGLINVFFSFSFFFCLFLV